MLIYVEVQFQSTETFPIHYFRETQKLTNVRTPSQLLNLIRNPNTSDILKTHHLKSLDFRISKKRQYRISSSLIVIINTIDSL